jgi:hypothetical protein
MNETQLLAVLAGFLTLWPASLSLRWLHPKSATWRIRVPLSLAYAALAAGWFWVFQWLEVPMLAYADVIVYGLMACWAVLLALGEWVTLSQHRVPGGVDKGGKGDTLTT